MKVVYDPLDRVAETTVTSAHGESHSVAYSYDGLGNLTSVADGGGRVVYRRDPAARRVVRLLPGGIKSTYEFGPHGIRSVRHVAGDGSLIASYSYQRDVRGLVTQIAERDARGARTIALTWDRAGRLIAERVGGVGAATRRYDQAPVAAVEYDQAGDPIRVTEAGQSTTYEFDSLHQLTKVADDDGSVEYLRDHLGNLTERRSAEESTYFLPAPGACGDQTIAEYDANGRLLAAYLYGETLVGCRHGDGSRSYFLEDGFGSIRITVDAKGKIEGRRDFSATGEVLAEQGDPRVSLRAAGERLDPQTGLMFVGGRALDPRSGRCLGADPTAAFDDLFATAGYVAAAAPADADVLPQLVPAQYREEERRAPPVVPVAPLVTRTQVPERSVTAAPLRQEPALAPSRIVVVGVGEHGPVDTYRPPGIPADTVVLQTSWARYQQTGNWLKELVVKGVDIGRAAVGYFAVRSPNHQLWQVERDTYQGILAQPSVQRVDFHSSASIAGYGLLDSLVEAKRSGRLPNLSEIALYGTAMAQRVTAEQRAALEAAGIRLVEVTNPAVQYDPVVMLTDPNRGLAERVLGAGGSLLNGGVALHNHQAPFDRSVDVPRAARFAADVGATVGRMVDDLFRALGQFATRPMGPLGPAGVLVDPIVRVARDVGGVEIRSQGEFTGDIGRITGLVHDPDTDRLVLIGDGATWLPPIDPQSFAVAFALLEAGYAEPAFSLDPADPTNPQGPKLKCVWFPDDILPGTAPGNVMFEADWLLKQYSFGVSIADDGTIGERSCAVPGYQSIFDLSFAHWSGSAKATWNRFWIVIGDVPLHAAGGAVVIGEPTVTVMTERMYTSSKGELTSSGGVVDPNAERFAKHFTEHYDEFAREEPAFAQLREWGKVFALAQWLTSENVAIDPSALPAPEAGRYVAQVEALSRAQNRERTYRRGNTIVTETRTVQLFGGDVIQTKPVLKADDGRASRLGDMVRRELRKSPSQPDLLLKLDGKERRGVVLPLTQGGKEIWSSHAPPDRVERDGITWRLDAEGRATSAETARGDRLELERDTAGEIIGFTSKSSDGWQAIANSVEGGRELQVIAPTGPSWVYHWNAAGALTGVTVDDQTLATVQPGRKKKNEAELQLGGYTEVLSWRDNGALESVTIVPPSAEAGGTRGSVKYHYEGGRLSGVTTSGGERIVLHYEGDGSIRLLDVPGGSVEYLRDGRGRVTGWSARDASARFGYLGDGEEIQTVSVERGGGKTTATFDSGRLVALTEANGAVWQCAYDEAGALTELTDPLGGKTKYAHETDSQGVRRLSETALPNGAKLRYEYDAAGRLSAVTLVPSEPLSQLENTRRAEPRRRPPSRLARRGLGRAAA